MLVYFISWTLRERYWRTDGDKLSYWNVNSINVTVKLHFFPFTTIFSLVWLAASVRHGITLEPTRRNSITSYCLIFCFCFFGHYLSDKHLNILSSVYALCLNEIIRFIVTINSFAQFLIINLQHFLIIKCFQALHNIQFSRSSGTLLSYQTSLLMFVLSEVGRKFCTISEKAIG